jgi:hypothetical protein
MVAKWPSHQCVSAVAWMPAGAFLSSLLLGDLKLRIGGAAGKLESEAVPAARGAAVAETETPDAVLHGQIVATGEPSAYSLAFPSLAHWNQERVYMTLLMGMPFSRSLAGLNATCPGPHRWCANNRTT